MFVSFFCQWIASVITPWGSHFPSFSDSHRTWIIRIVISVSKKILVLIYLWT